MTEKRFGWTAMWIFAAILFIAGIAAGIFFSDSDRRWLAKDNSEMMLKEGRLILELQRCEDDNKQLQTAIGLCEERIRDLTLGNEGD